MARFDFARIMSQLGPELQNLGPQIAPILQQLASGSGGGQSTQGQSGSSTDTVQNILDIIGIADPSPAVDTVNAIISLVRASKATNPGERHQHLKNAGISLVAGWIPYLGDFAKLGKQNFRQAAGGMRGGGGGGGLIPPPPPTASGSGSVLSGALPFLAGAGAGAAFGMFGGGGGRSSDEFPSKYGLSGLFMNRAQQEMAGDVGRMGRRQMSAAWDALSINPLSWASAIKKTFDNVVEMPGALMNWGQSLKDSQEHLKNFSGLLAHTYQVSQVREIMRNIGSAARTGGTTTDLVRALDTLKDDFQGYRDVVTNVANSVATFGLKLLDNVIKVVERFTAVDEIRDQINEWLNQQKNQKPAVFEMMDSIRKLPRTGTRKPHI